LLLKFYESYGDAETRLDAFLQAGDVDSALQMLHAMKGVAANLAMPELRKGIEALEQTLKKTGKYESEILTDFMNAKNRVLESFEQLRSVNDQATAAADGVA
jgi:two-component system sensor histidine kinase/response regulator